MLLPKMTMIILNRNQLPHQTETEITYLGKLIIDMISEMGFGMTIWGEQHLLGSGRLQN